MILSITLIFVPKYFNKCDYVNVEDYNTMSKGFELSVLSVNIRSYYKNIDLFSGFLSSVTTVPSIIVLTETWLNHDNLNNANINMYCSKHSIRESRRSGGVSIYYRDNLIVNVLEDLCINDCVIECCAVNLVVSGRNTVIPSHLPATLWYH